MLLFNQERETQPTSCNCRFVYFIDSLLTFSRLPPQICKKKIKQNMLVTTISKQNIPTSKITRNLPRRLFALYFKFEFISYDM